MRGLVMAAIGENKGGFIRPFANVPVVPDTTRTVLFQPSN